MKINIPKDWFMSKAHLEEGHKIGAGVWPSPSPSAAAAGSTGKDANLKLCMGHKLELSRLGYGSIEAFAQFPNSSETECQICNGTWARNHKQNS